MNINQQLIAYIKPLVLNQARFQISTEWMNANVPPALHDDMMDVIANGMTDEQTETLLGEHNPLLADDALLQFTEEATLVVIFHDDHVVDPLCDYISKNGRHCHGLWTWMYNKLLSSQQG